MTLRYLPWPVPACAGTVLGIMFLQAGAWPALPLLLACLLLCRTQPAPLLCLILLLSFMALGGLRYWQWQQRPDPLAGLPRDQGLLLGGTSDGTVLDLDWPVKASLWISPAGSLPEGGVVVWGRLLDPAGKRNPGGFDFRAHLAARGIDGQLLVEEVRQHEPATSLRSRLRAGLRHGLAPQAAALTEALTLGERSELGDLRDSFAAAGLSHLLALSGLHLGVLISAFGRVTRRLGPLRRPLLAAVVVLFLLTVGVSASLLRAALMALAYLLTDWAGSGRADSLTSLTLAALLTLLWQPVWLFDLSFQLSYLCLLGILVCALPLLRPLLGQPWWSPRVLVTGAMVTSAAAQLPTLSLVASTFGTVPLFSVFVNLLAIPIASLLVPLGLLAAVLGAILPVLALLPNLLTGALAGLLIATAESAAALPSVPWGEVSAVGHWYWAVACLVLMMLCQGSVRLLAAALITTCALLSSLSTPAGHPQAELIALDVGQGDAFLLTFRPGPSVLVDAGGNAWSDFDPGERVVVPALRALGVTSLDLVVATHADADHVGGLPAVLDALPVQALAIGAAETGRALFGELLDAARRNAVPVIQLSRAETVRLGGLSLQVLNPGPDPTGEANEDSLAFNVFWQDRAVAVLPGEVSAAVEATLPVAPAAVMTVPHHGSRFSSSARLLQAVAGHTAVLSVGRNNYGHPHGTVLQRLDSHGYSVLSTLELGAVRVPLLAHERGIGTR